jgi:hypothetical protein
MTESRGTMTTQPQENNQPEKMRRRRGAPKGTRSRLTHGLKSMKNALIRSKQVRLDMRFRLGKALVRWRLELVQDLGGEEQISTQQTALIELAVRSKLMLDTIDNWILSQPSLVNKSKKMLLPVVVQRQQLADGLARYLKDLGLERRHKVETWQEITAKDDDTPANGNGVDAPPCTLRMSPGKG